MPQNIVVYVVFVYEGLARMNLALASVFECNTLLFAYKNGEYVKFSNSC